MKKLNHQRKYRPFVVPSEPSHRLNWTAFRELDTSCVRCGNTGVIDGFGLASGAEPDTQPCPCCNGGHVDPLKTVRFVDVNPF